MAVFQTQVHLLKIGEMLFAELDLIGFDRKSKRSYDIDTLYETQALTSFLTSFIFSSVQF